MRCRDVAERATDFTEGAGGLLFRLRVRGHLAGCDDCRTHIAQLVSVAQALPALGRAEVDPRQHAAAMSAFRLARPQRVDSTLQAELPADAAAASTARISWAVAFTAVWTLLSVALARHRLPFERAWVEAALGALLALALMAKVRRAGLVASSIASAGALALALLNRPGALDVDSGIRCAAHVLIAAAVPLVALLWRRGSMSYHRMTLVGASLGGAFAGDAALHVACPAGGSQAHALVFHLGSTIAAALLVALLSPRLQSSGTLQT